MNDRTPLMLVVIALLTAVAVYANLDLVRPGFKHSPALVGMLFWQDESQRSLVLRRGLDLQGGLQVLLQAAQTQERQLAPGDLEAARTIIENRVNALGVTEPQVQSQGADKIVVELPGVQDPDLAVRTIGQTALLEFVNAGTSPLQEGDVVSTTYPVLFDELPEGKKNAFLGDPNDPLGTGESGGSGAGATGATTDTQRTATPAGGAGATTGLTTTGATTSTAAITATGATTATATTGGGEAGGGAAPELKTLYPTVLTGELVDQAQATFDATSGWVVSFQLTSDGGQRLQRYTTDHIDQYMPILLDKKVVSSPSIRSTISSDGQITGRFTQASAQALAAQINSGSLPVPLKVVGQNLVGPTLGGEAVDASIKGGLVGLVAVMLFMLLYYRMPGLLADLALVLYALFSLTIFRMYPFTLTLAGIAGFVLSVGIAVDANILIFERMKEELRAGRSVRAAMDTGWARAWPSIRDSNFSTLITCLILLWFGGQFGASVVKGFAITLAVGVVTSMFTAIVVTRTFLRVVNRLILHESGVPTMEDRRLRFLFGF